MKFESRVTNTDDFREYICGWGAAFINIIVTFPMNKVMFRQMLHGVSTYQAIHQLHQEGLGNLYRGCLPPLIQKTISVSIMFGSYNGYKRFLEKSGITQKTIKNSAAALLAGSTESILVPFERIQVLLQDKKHHDRFRNTFHAFNELWPYGFREYYRGLTPILMRNGPSTLMFFSLRDEIRHLLPLKSNVLWQRTLGDLVCGALLGAFISTVTYPINVVKTSMQAQYGTPFQSFVVVFQQVYEARGRSLRKMFYGVHVNFSRALVSWGIINASYEFFKRTYINRFGNGSHNYKT